MARGYSSTGLPNVNGTALKTMGTIISTTAVRPRLFDLILSNQLPPAEQAAQFAVTRFTAAGTTAGSPPIGVPTDPADPAAVATLGWTHSVEPTYAANTDLLTINLNQRATFRWVASPGYELIGTNAAANGIGARVILSTANIIEYANMFWYE